VAGHLFRSTETNVRKKQEFSNLECARTVSTLPIKWVDKLPTERPQPVGEVSANFS
jgi:hypothetical protein